MTKFGQAREGKKRGMELAVNLLWTGGWDSTFRLLHVILFRERTIKPYYVIDPGRISFCHEIMAMEKIKSIMFKQYPESRGRLLPTEFKILSDIEPNDSISQRFKRLRSANFLGEQYEWLARFADEYGIPGLELPIHKDDKAYDIIASQVCEEFDGQEHYFRLEENPDNPDVKLFSYFRFPLLDLSKLQMQELAEKYHFQDIMEHTWFCHRPLKNGLPCGTCNPCSYTIVEGLVRRIPLWSRVRHHVKSVTPMRLIGILRKSKIFARKWVR